MTRPPLYMASSKATPTPLLVTHNLPNCGLVLSHKSQIHAPLARSLEKRETPSVAPSIAESAATSGTFVLPRVLQSDFSLGNLSPCVPLKLHWTACVITCQDPRRSSSWPEGKRKGTKACNADVLRLLAVAKSWIVAQKCQPPSRDCQWTGHGEILNDTLVKRLISVLHLQKAP